MTAGATRARCVTRMIKVVALNISGKSIVAHSSIKHSFAYLYTFFRQILEIASLRRAESSLPERAHKPFNCARQIEEFRLFPPPPPPIFCACPRCEMQMQSPLQKLQMKNKLRLMERTPAHPVRRDPPIGGDSYNPPALKHDL